MKTSTTIKNITAVTLFFFLLAASIIPAAAQIKAQKSPGGYHGELDFPISWKRYYAYAEWTQIMKDIQKKYPQLSDIQSIGKSRMGRDQLLITITSKSTGKHQDKPAMWVDGAIHGNEVNGITCSLYLMWYLLTRYDYDSYVHELVDSCTFYILPGLNVDANDSFVRYPNTPHNPREPYRPEDNDGDGLYDEDRTEDVDGDGELSTMYIKDSKGNFKLSPDGRQFLPISDDKEGGARFRMLGPEGFDNDGDGMLNEDDIGGPDPNRNYPYGWNLPDGNPYPMSESETRNAYEFQLAHPNIYASFHYHNIGRLIMFQVPPEKPAQNQSPEQKLRRRQYFEQSLAELKKTNKYAQLFDRQVPEAYQHDMDIQTEIVTMGARILKNYSPVLAGLSGQAHAATYYMLGAYSYLIELWGAPDFEADENGDGRVTDEEYLKWIDTELTGEGWIDPHPVDHPDLGNIWIGGTRKKHTQRTPPARYIEMEAFKNAQFVMYCASQFPKIMITDISVIPKTNDLYWIEAEVKNDRIYPTSSDRSVQLKKAVMDVISIDSSSNISVIDIGKGETMIDPTDVTGTALAVTETPTEFRLKGKQTQRFCSLVKMNGSKGWIRFQVKSRHGGTDDRKIELNLKR